MSRSEEAYQYLKNAIMADQLQPNQPIAELSVAAELNMSRSPIREALRKLEAEGLIVTYPSRGSFVAALSSSDVEEIYSLRVLLECWALERSINRIPNELLDELEEEFRSTATDESWEGRHLADRKLHGAITEAAGSKRLIEFINILNSQTERIRRMSAMDKARSQRSLQEHLELIQHLRERDLKKARISLTKHLRAVADSAIESFKYTHI